MQCVHVCSCHLILPALMCRYIVDAFPLKSQLLSHPNRFIICCTHLTRGSGGAGLTCQVQPQILRAKQECRGTKSTMYQFHGRCWAGLEVEIQGAEGAVESTTPIEYTIQQLQNTCGQVVICTLKKQGAKNLFWYINNSYSYLYCLSFLPTLLQFRWHKHFSRSNLVLWPNILAEKSSIITTWCIQNE